MSATSGWSDARNVLCIRLDNMGDVLMSTPAMRALKTSCAGRRITLLASPSGAAAAPHIPELDATIVYQAPWVQSDSLPPDRHQAMIAQLREQRFDAAVIFTVYSQSPLPAALLCLLAGIPRVLAHCRENPYHLISDWVRETEPQAEPRHEAQRQLDLVATVGARAADTRLSFHVRDEDQAALDRLLDQAGMQDGGGWIVAHCGATAPSRRYPPALFARALDLLAQEGRPILMTGSASERALVREVIGLSRAPQSLTDLSGRLSLGQLGALLQRAGVLVSNNSGPVHMAAALGTPVVDLYALTNPQHTPWQVPHRVLYQDVPCKYCYRSVCPEGHHACLAGVAPERVDAAARELLDPTVRAERTRLGQPVPVAVPALP
jgi:lipopolysaccharide heptosyltransferase II